MRRWAVAMAVIAGVTLLPWGRVGSGQDAGTPLYPDLEARPPSDLYLATEILADGRPHHLLRFETTAANVGEGRLEMVGDAAAPTEPGVADPVHQNLYDAPSGGDVVATPLLNADIVYHPTHFHFHLAEFAAYRLLRREATGELRPTDHAGAKTSSCLLDSDRVDDGGPESAQYEECERDRQGISVGWADVYDASLPDQWVDLGVAGADAPLPDGEYAVEFRVDPADRIAEDGREDNNLATTSFVVRDGRIADHPEPPRCAPQPASGRVGDALRLDCAGFAPGKRVSVHWDQRDVYERNAPDPIAEETANRAGEATLDVTVPESPFGGHNLVVVDEASGSTVSIVGVVPGLSAAPVGRGLGMEIVLSGFGAGETVALTWARADGTVAGAGQVDVSALGSARITVPNRSLSGETLDVRASGQRSGGTAMTTAGAPLAASPAATPGVSPAATPGASPPAGAHASPPTGGWRLTHRR